MKMKLTEAEAQRVREWFHSLQDIHPDYLETEDYYLAMKLYLQLSDCRIPHSVMEGCKASETRTETPPELTDRLMSRAVR